VKWLRYTALGMLRNPLRVGLTLLAVAVAVFLFATVTSLDRGLRRMLETSSRPGMLVVFDKYQGCPPLSKLPAAHQAVIEDLPGVEEVTGELFVISSCSRATDLVAVHGIEPDKFRRFRDIRLPDAEYEAFAAERGAALIGSKVAAKYGWKPGQSVSLERLGGITFTVRGIFSAPGDSLENTILVDLEYLQLASEQPGKVTLFYARVNDPDQTVGLASAIDGQLASSISPTKTTTERAFLDSAVSGLSGLVEFAALLGYGALGMIVVGVGNSLAMSMRDRTREIAILKIVGFRRPQVLRLMLSEAVVCSLAGGVLGAGAAFVLVALSRFSLSVEGFTFAPYLSTGLLLEAILLAGLLGAIAGYTPARRVSRLAAAAALREVD